MLCENATALRLQIFFSGYGTDVANLFLFFSLQCYGTDVADIFQLNLTKLRRFKIKLRKIYDSEVCQGEKFFSQVLYILILHREYTRVLTFQNFVRAP